MTPRGEPLGVLVTTCNEADFLGSAVYLAFVNFVH